MPQSAACDGPRLNISLTLGGTIFGGIGGGSLSGEVGISIPLDPREGIGQLFLKGNKTSLTGAGAYIGGGPGAAIGVSRGPVGGYSTGWGSQGGLGWGGGAEGGTTGPNFPDTYSGWGASGGARAGVGYGAYVAAAEHKSYTLATPTPRCGL